MFVCVCVCVCVRAYACLQDLNRVWNDPSKKLHPTIHALKTHLKTWVEEREVSALHACGCACHVPPPSSVAAMHMQMHGYVLPTQCRS